MSRQDENPTADGYDIQTQVYMANFMLAKECYPILEISASARDEARIVTLTTLNRNTPSMTLEKKYFVANQAPGDLGGNGSSLFLGGPNFQRFQQCKLANVAFTMALHDRLNLHGSRVKALVADCGVVKAVDPTSPEYEESSLTSAEFFLGFAVAQTVDNASVPALYCCFSPEAASGDFWGPGGVFSGDPKRIAKAGKFESPCYESLSLDGPGRLMLWDVSEDALGRFDVMPSA